MFLNECVSMLVDNEIKKQMFIVLSAKYVKIWASFSHILSSRESKDVLTFRTEIWKRKPLTSNTLHL
jgi:hypothetical protein